MRRLRTTRTLVLLAALSVAALALAAAPVGASHEDRPSTNNLHPLGDIVEPASLLNADIGNPNIHTDIAFWGKHAFRGTWLGFNVWDISAPGNPKQVSFTTCTDNQGDMIVWDDILVRSWNTPAPLGATCDGSAVPAGFEGLHVIDVGNPNDPELIASVDLSTVAIPGRCG